MIMLERRLHRSRPLWQRPAREALWPALGPPALVSLGACDDVRVSVKFLEFWLLSELGRELEELYGMVIFLGGAKRDTMNSNSCLQMFAIQWSVFKQDY